MPAEESDVRWRRLARNPVSYVQARGIFAGQDGCARGRANRAGRIRLREFHPLASQAIDIWRAIELAAKASCICPAHVIDEDEDDIGMPARRFHAG